MANFNTATAFTPATGGRPGSLTAVLGGQVVRAIVAIALIAPDRGALRQLDRVRIDLPDRNR
jgi:hypothetical protein